MDLSDGTVEQVERLVSELRAINHWDTEYRKRHRPERYETVAFASRQKRRKQIMLQLHELSRSQSGSNDTRSADRAGPNGLCHGFRSNE
jgi:hypothetical protein